MKKKKKKKNTKNTVTTQGDQDEAPRSVIEMDEELSEEGYRKRDLVLEALQSIKTQDFTELKTMRAPAEQVKLIIIFAGQLLLGKPCDFRQGLLELVSKPKTFIELSLGLEERLEASHLDVLKDI